MTEVNHNKHMLTLLGHCLTEMEGAIVIAVVEDLDPALLPLLRKAYRRTQDAWNVCEESILSE